MPDFYSARCPVRATEESIFPSRRRTADAVRVRPKRKEWRSVRRVLGNGDDVAAKTIRHTIVTCRHTNRVPGDEEGALLHRHA